MKNAMAQDEAIKGAKAIWYGDAAVYTGESEFLHGATCYAIELIEGVKVDAYECRCARCGHVWISRGAEVPNDCAKCKSPSWRVLPGTVRPGRKPGNPAR